MISDVLRQRLAELLQGHILQRDEAGRRALPSRQRRAGSTPRCPRRGGRRRSRSPSPSMRFIASSSMIGDETDIAGDDGRYRLRDHRRRSPSSSSISTSSPRLTLQGSPPAAATSRCRFRASTRAGGRRPARGTVPHRPALASERQAPLDMPMAELHRQPRGRVRSGERREAGLPRTRPPHDFAAVKVMVASCRSLRWKVTSIMWSIEPKDHSEPTSIGDGQRHAEDAARRCAAASA